MTTSPHTAALATRPADQPETTITPQIDQPRKRRLDVLDVVRGAALCGILFANVATITGVYVPWQNGQPPLSHTVLNLLVQQRFFPVFSLLFGVGFGMLWTSASRRAVHPRIVLMRRLLALGLLGVLHQILQPGEALLPYAIVGLVVLLPLTLIRRYRAVVAGIAGIVATIAGVFAGGMGLIPGLFLLGFAIAELRLPQRAEDSAKPGVILAIVAGLAAILFIVLQLASPTTAGFDATSAAAGLLQGMAIIGALAALLHTPLRRALVACFAPLGRMALTNYVGATVLGVLLSLPWGAPVGRLRHLESMPVTDDTMFLIWAGCIGLLLVQALISRWWLGRFGQGPLERLWRWATWSGAARLEPSKA